MTQTHITHKKGHPENRDGLGQTIEVVVRLPGHRQLVVARIVAVTLDRLTLQVSLVETLQVLQLLGKSRLLL